MLSKFNTIARLIIVLLLVVPIYPMPPAFASEITETETFDGTNGAQVTDLGIPSGNYAIDDGDNVAIRNDQNCCGVSGQYFFSLLDNQTAQNANTTSFTFTLPTDHDVKEVGFRMAGVNSDWSIQYNYSDASGDQESKSGQSGASYEDITKSITGKFITSFTVTVSDWSGIDTIYWKYDDTTTTTTTSTTTSTTTTSTTTTTTTTTIPQTVGVPTDQSLNVDYHNGQIVYSWTAPTDGTQTPESYTVQMGRNGVLDQNPTTTSTSMTWTHQNLKDNFTLETAVGSAFMFHVKSTNATHSIESAFTDVVTATISDMPAGPTNITHTNTAGSGLVIDWDDPDTGFTSASHYMIDYSSDGAPYEVDSSLVTQINNITDTTYTISYDDLADGSYYFRVLSCSSTGNCLGQSDGATQVIVFDDTVYFVGPPMNPVVSNVYGTGVLVDWDEPNTGNRTAEYYELYYRIEGTTNNTLIDNIKLTEYTIPYSAIADGTYVFSLRAYSSTHNLYSGYSTEPTLAVVNQEAIDNYVPPAPEPDPEPYVAPPPPPPPVVVIVGGEETEYTQSEVDDGTVERDQQRAKNLELYGVELTDEQIARGDAGDIELINEDEETEAGEFPEDDDLVLLPETTDYDEEPIYEVYDEDEGWVEVSEEEFEEILEYEAERDAKELEILETYDLEELEDLNLYIPEDEYEDLTEEEIKQIEKEFEEFIETILVVEEYLESIEDDFEIEPVLILPVTEIVIDEDDLPKEGRLPPIPEDDEVLILEVIEEDGEPVIIIPDDVDVFEVELLPEEEIEELTEEEYQEYKEQKKEVIETYVEELEEEIIEEVLPETVSVEEYKEIKEKDVEELTEDEIELVVEVTEQVIEEVVDIEELEEVIVSEEIEILEDEVLEDLSEEELEVYEEELEEVIENYVEELEVEELVVVVEQIAEVGVENLATADTQTVKVVQAVVAEVVDTEKVEELSDQEQEAVADVLGFEEVEDVEIIAEVAAKDETVAEAVSEYVERAVENTDLENYTLADVVTEVQVEAFLENPIGELVSVNIVEMDLGSIGSDMTSDQKEKAQEVVVPVIIASQIIAQAGALIRRF